MAVIVDKKSTQEVVRFLRECWAPVFGMPRTLVCDEGREFVSRALEEFASESSVHLYHIGVQAPWQHGRIFKSLLAACTAAQPLMGYDEMMMGRLQYGHRRHQLLSDASGCGRTKESPMVLIATAIVLLLPPRSRQGHRRPAHSGWWGCVNGQQLKRDGPWDPDKVALEHVRRASPMEQLALVSGVVVDAANRDQEWEIVESQPRMAPALAPNSLNNNI